MDIITIIVSTIVGCATITGTTYKCYKIINDRNQNRVEQIQLQQPPSPVIEHIVKEAINHHLERKNSKENNLEVDIKIQIETHSIDENMEK